MITPAYSPTATERVLPRMALDFTTGTLDPRVTVTRALNTATRVNSSGLIAGVNADLPRFDYDPVTLAPKGLLVEEARTNLCIRSSDLGTGWTPNSVSVSTDVIASPSGATDADSVTPSAGSAQHRLIGTQSAVSSGVSVTHSVFAKAGGSNFVQLHDSATATFYANFDLANGTVTAVNPANGATITNYGNGWYRCTLTFTTGTTNCGGVVAMIPNGSAARNPTWTAAGTESVYAWGYQIETGAFATSYIPTTTASLTRNADVVTMTGTNFSSWYNIGAGSWYIQTNARNAATILTAGSFSLSANTTALKKYASVYTSDQSAISLVLGVGTVMKVSYYKQALLSAELAALTN